MAERSTAMPGNGAFVTDSEAPERHDGDGVSSGAARSPELEALLSSGLATPCYYSERPRDRPCCKGLGVVRYGPITLCRDCDRRRSAVGKAMTAVRLPDPGALLEVLAAEAARRRAELDLREAVGAARRAGQSWSAIGAILGVTRQAAQQRFDGREAIRRGERR
jgi:hypothetical protein